MVRDAGVVWSGLTNRANQVSTLELEPEKSLVFWVFTTAHAIESALNEKLSPFGITIRQVQILGILALYDEVVQSEIAEMLRVEPSSVVRLLDRMERDGWIARQTDPHDRRRKIVVPTEKATPVWEQILRQGSLVKERGLEGIPPDALDTTQQTLHKIRENLVGAIGKGEPPPRPHSRNSFPPESSKQIT